MSALAGEVDLYMGILNLLSKEPAKAEAEQDTDQAGQTATKSSPPRTRGIYPRSEDERRFFGDFEVGADAEPIPIPTNSPHRDEMSGKVNIEGFLKPRNTLQQPLPGFDTQQPTRTYERLTASKRMRTEAIRGDNVPHTEEPWDLHGDREYQKRKKLNSRESIVISDDEMVTHRDASGVGWLEDASHPTISLGSEMEVSPSTMNGDVSEFREVEKLMKAGRGGKSSSGTTDRSVFKFRSRELRNSLPNPPSQPSSTQVEEISDDEVHMSPKPAVPYKGTSFLDRQAVKRLDKPRSRQVLQNVKSMRQTDTKSAYFAPTHNQRDQLKQRHLRPFSGSSTPTNSRNVFRRAEDVDDSPDVLHNGDNVGIRNPPRIRDLMTANGHSGPTHRSRSPPQESSVSNFRSPNDISITRFGSKKKAETPGQATPNTKNNRASQGTCFRLQKLVYGHSSLDLGDHEYRLKLDFANGDAKVTFECQCGASGCSVYLNCLAFPVIKVVKISFGGTMVHVTLSKESNHENVYLLEFVDGSESVRFVEYLIVASKCDKVQQKESGHMQKVFWNSERMQQQMLRASSSRQHYLRSRLESRSDMELEQDAYRTQHNNERQRLKRDDGQIDAQPTTKRRRSGSYDHEASVQQASASCPSEVDNPKDDIFEGNRHEARSKNRSEMINRDLGGWSENRRLEKKQVLDFPKSKFSELKREHKPWDKPLVFPIDGPKKTTVDFGDLERLDEGEFLNDNIIAFYLRYLERDLEVTHPSIAKRIYFFNTFFYERLTSRSSGRKGINYQGVQKWTSRVDIFNFDYVVVPVNESAHWYVAIICNLPNLSRTLNKEEKEGSLEVGLGDKRSDGLVQVAEPSSPNSPPQTTVADAVDLGYGVTEAGEQVARISLIQRETAEETGNPDLKNMLDDNAEDESWPAADENPPTSAADGIPSIGQDADYRVQAGNAKSGEDLAKVRVKAQHRLKKSKRRLTFRKYDIDEPVIIILDSLGLTHPPTARNLKEYLIEEGKSKRQLQVLIEDISAMNSKEIPLQGNYCDCGIYLLSYIEKFLKDPRSFTNGILRREMDQKNDWPDLNPSVKRDHLRELLLGLYKQQNYTRREEAISKGKYHKEPRQVTHGSKEGLLRDLTSQGIKHDQRKPDLPEAGHEARNTEATASIGGVSITGANDGLEDSLLIIDGHPSENEPDFAPGGNRLESRNTAEPRGDSHGLGLLLENTSSRIRKDDMVRVDASIGPTKQPLAKLLDSRKSPERYLRRTSKAHSAENTGLEVVISPRRRTRNQRPSPELNDESIILD